MGSLLQSGLSALIPRDNRLTFTLLLAGTGALALFLDYYYKERHNGSKEKKLPGVGSKIESGNNKLEEAIRYYESALVDMQRQGVDDGQRMQIRAMLLRAYEIQAILSPDEFKLRSSIMIEGASSTAVREMIEDNLAEIDSSGLTGLHELQASSSHDVTITQTTSSRDVAMTPTTSSRDVTMTAQYIPPHVQRDMTPRPRTDSLSSGLSDFYEAFDFLEDDEEESEDMSAFYKDQMFLHRVKAFESRKNRFQQFNLSSPTEYLVKVQCIRLALDRLVRFPEKRQWMLDMGRALTVKLLKIAGDDTEAFCTAYDAMIRYVEEPSNMCSIKTELKVRRVACFNVYDVVLDFCLLDSFDDLDMPPAAVTSVISNSWISQGIRKSMLSAAVWGLITSKVKKAAPDGFLRRFYDIMGVLTPSLAWGFLGDDPVLHPMCMLVRHDTITSLLQIFDDRMTDYTSVSSLSEDLYDYLHDSASRITAEFDKVL